MKPWEMWHLRQIAALRQQAIKPGQRAIDLRPRKAGA